MIAEKEIVNPIPMRTWRWLGVNAAQLRQELPTMGIYDKKPLIEEMAGMQSIKNQKGIPADVAAYAAKIDCGLSEAMDKTVSAVCNSGYVIEIAVNEQRPQPIQLRYVLDEAAPALTDEHIIVARENSEATVIISYAGDGRLFHNGRTRVYAEKGAKLHLIKVQLLAGEAQQLDAIGAYAEAGACIDATVVEIGAARSVTSLKINLAGDESTADIKTIYFGDGTRELDMNYIIRQEGKKTDGHMEIQGALLDKSQKIFRGTLDFIRGSKGSVGREAENVVVLSPDVRNRSVPLMLSGEDDVDGHHAVSVGKMDENKLFYLMSRGLSLRDAEKMVIAASFQPALQRIPDEEIKGQIEEYIRRRLANVE